MPVRLPKGALVVFVIAGALLASLLQLGTVTGAQSGTPVSDGTPAAEGTPAQPGALVPGAQTWNILVNNLSPEGENWSFNTFYPDHIEAHPGDRIRFTLANNPHAMHTVMALAPVLNPMEFYSGFNGGFRQPDLTRPGGWQTTFFGNEELATDDPNVACGRVVHDACVLSYAPGGVEFGINSSILVNPPTNGGDGNTVFTIILDPTLPLGPYYAMSLVDGPTMQMRIDLVAADQPVQSAGDVQQAAQRQYEADLSWLAAQDRVHYPAEASNPDGTKTWQVEAGVTGQGKQWLAINEFAPSQMMIRAGDTITWTNDGPGLSVHTVTGFAATHDAIPDMNPYQAGCVTSDGELILPPEGTFPPDIWNTCAGFEVNNLTEYSDPSAPSGEPYIDGPRTSGILLNQDYLDSPVGDGLPYASSYSVTFPNPGTYTYECAIHPGMTGTVVVLPLPTPR